MRVLEGIRKSFSHLSTIEIHHKVQFETLNKQRSSNMCVCVFVCLAETFRYHRIFQFSNTGHDMICGWVGLRQFFVLLLLLLFIHVFSFGIRDYTVHWRRRHWRNQITILGNRRYPGLAQTIRSVNENEFFFRLCCVSIFHGRRFHITWLWIQIGFKGAVGLSLTAFVLWYFFYLSHHSAHLNM